MPFRFEHKEYILLFAGIGVLALLFFFLLQWKQKVAKRIGDPRMVAVLTRNFSPAKFLLKLILVGCAIAMGIIAVMNPRKPGSFTGGERKGIDIAIALDVSKSMLAPDLAPNRLERARQFITRLMNQLPDDRIALVLFAGKAYLQMPLTADHGAAQLFVAAATPDAVPQQGTVISDALDMSARVFTGRDKRFKTVILISDGEDHDEDAVPTAKKLADQGVQINTIGIGSPEGSTIPDPATGDIKRDEAGNPVVSKLNERILQDVANATNGTYLRLESSDAAVKELAAKLSTIDKTSFADQSQLNFTSYYWIFAILMFLLLIIETILPERKAIPV